MKKAILFGALGALVLSSCSLLERHEDVEDPTAETAATEATSVADGGPSMESEVSRLNTKVSALETKLDVLTANMERMEMQRSQPIIEAQSAPQPTMAAPVEVPESTQVSAAPVQPSASLPVSVKSSDADDTGAEKDFRAAMVLFQNGKNMEAASRFALLAKKFPQHLLASHSLYWAGEASARGQQWSLATENWEELERRYPRSAYVPEALAGLARAYDNQGNAGKAKMYRETLLKAFPKSPVTLSMHASDAVGVSTPKRVMMKPEPTEDGENAPVYKEEPSETEGE